MYNEIVPTQCQHCEDAPCAAVCPTHATYVTDSGVVLVDPEKCIGCKYCMAACPYQARIVQESTGVVEKCRFWLGKRRAGQPARLRGDVHIRGARVRRPGRPESDISQAIAQYHAQPLASNLTASKIYYVR